MNLIQIFGRKLSTEIPKRIIKNVEGKPFVVHETEFAGVTQRWNYRSEIVKRDKLDHKHKYIWMIFAGLSACGFVAFALIKTQVIEGRKEEMLAREKLRRDLKLSGEERKKIGPISNNLN
uniref:Uncharacterized protein n=1 Tax=Rhabditophanes sp. KR3021 TaxID=114890 RepID=A0AC35UFZ4_9BILA